MALAAALPQTASQGACGPGPTDPLHAPAPDFRYVGLEPVAAPRLGAAATAFGLGAGVTLAMSSVDTRQALVAGAMTRSLRTGASASTIPSLRP